MDLLHVITYQYGTYTKTTSIQVDNTFLAVVGVLAASCAVYCIYKIYQEDSK